MFFLKREISTYIFGIVVINKQKYCFERKKGRASSQKVRAFSPVLYLGKE